jgi:hypothetical protein
LPIWRIRAGGGGAHSSSGGGFGISAQTPCRWRVLVSGN